MGAHLFDLLDKLAMEGGPSEDARRAVVCEALNAVARAGAPVVRIWGTLKRTGTREEVDRAADMLALVLDENARRTHPLRFVVVLVNHQPGYGSPDPTRSLDDQDASSPWSARRFYLEQGWKAPGKGLLKERLETFGAIPALAQSREVLAWEMVNELDAFRIAPGGDLRSREGRTLRATFFVPAIELAASLFTQPVLAGEIRGAAEGYVEMTGALHSMLAPETRARLVWTTHLYPRRDARGAVDLARAFEKLDRDLDFASGLGLPLLVGEVGEVVGAGKFCEDGPAHALAPIFEALRKGPRANVETAIAWGEGLCDLRVGERRLRIGAGADGADLGPHDPARAELERRRASFTPIDPSGNSTAK